MSANETRKKLLEALAVAAREKDEMQHRSMQSTNPFVGAIYAHTLSGLQQAIDTWSSELEKMDRD